MDEEFHLQLGSYSWFAGSHVTFGVSAGTVAGNGDYVFGMHAHMLLLNLWHLGARMSAPTSKCSLESWSNFPVRNIKDQHVF